MFDSELMYVVNVLIMYNFISKKSFIYFLLVLHIPEISTFQDIVISLTIVYILLQINVTCFQKGKLLYSIHKNCILECTLYCYRLHFLINRQPKAYIEAALIGVSNRIELSN